MASRQEYIQLFGSDFASTLDAIDNMPPELNQIVTSVLDGMVFDVDIFTTNINKTISTMASRGIDTTTILNTLKDDMDVGGRIFGQLKNSTKNSVVQGISDSAKLGQLQNYDMKQTFRWVTVSGHKICIDCQDRAGQEATFEEWEQRGLPGSGWSICREYCYCMLDPTGNAPKQIQGVDVREKGAGTVKAPVIPTKEDSLNRIGVFAKEPTAISPVTLHINKTGKVNFPSASKQALAQISAGVERVLNRFNVNVNYIGEYTDIIKTRGASAFHASFGSGESVIAFKKGYIKGFKRTAKESKEAFAYSKARDLENAKKQLEFKKDLKAKGKGIGDIDGRIASLEKQLKVMEDERYNKWSISSVHNNPLEATTIHESWHRIDSALGFNQEKLRDIFMRRLDDLEVPRTDYNFVSQYAASGIGKPGTLRVSELFAETGTAIELGYYVPPKIQQAFVETLADAGFTYP